MKLKLVPIMLFVCFVLLFVSACGTAEEVQDDLRWFDLEISGNKQTVSVSAGEVEDVLFGKYYVFSKENEEQELLWDFEHRLMSIELIYPPDYEDIKVGSLRDYFHECLVEECNTKSEELGISFADYVRQNYQKDSRYNPENALYNFNDPDYLRSFAREYGYRWSVVNCVAKLWGLEADSEEIEKYISEGMSEEKAEYEALKQAVFRCSVENSRIVYRHKSPMFYLLKRKAWDAISTNTGMGGGEHYVVGEDGYAAVYMPWFATRGDDLDPYVGEHIYGTSSIYGTYRFADRDNWDYIVVRCGGGDYMLATFDHWIEEAGEEYDNFVALYGVEPKIHP
ncbi:MAG: hypothetical protein IIX84_06975 [Oscillospiraceae bacterium]|nr:hypothetical protein [Oscillospiraceae bacterium]